jgi:hypothetical protein
MLGRVMIRFRRRHHRPPRDVAFTPKADIPSCTARYAACFAFASKRARAFFPSLAATAMPSKKTGELSNDPHRQAR